MKPKKQPKKASPESIDFVLANQRHLQETLFDIKATVKHVEREVGALPTIKHWEDVLSTLKNYGERLKFLEDNVLLAKHEPEVKAPPAIINTAGMRWWHWLLGFFVLIFNVALIVA